MYTLTYKKGDAERSTPVCDTDSTDVFLLFLSGSVTVSSQEVISPLAHFCLVVLFMGNKCNLCYKGFATGDISRHESLCLCHRTEQRSKPN